MSPARYEWVGPAPVSCLRVGGVPHSQKWAPGRMHTRHRQTRRRLRARGLALPVVAAGGDGRRRAPRHRSPLARRGRIRGGGVVGRSCGKLVPGDPRGCSLRMGWSVSALRRSTPAGFCIGLILGEAGHSVASNGHDVGQKTHRPGEAKQTGYGRLFGSTTKQGGGAGEATE